MDWINEDGTRCDPQPTEVHELPGKNSRAMRPLLEDLAEKDAEIERLRMIEAAAINLVAQKGRYQTEKAYKQMVALLVTNK